VIFEGVTSAAGVVGGVATGGATGTAVLDATGASDGFTAAGSGAEARGHGRGVGRQFENPLLECGDIGIRDLPARRHLKIRVTILNDPQQQTALGVAWNYHSPASTTLHEGRERIQAQFAGMAAERMTAVAILEDDGLNAVLK